MFDFFLELWRGGQFLSAHPNLHDLQQKLSVAAYVGGPDYELKLQTLLQHPQIHTVINLQDHEGETALITAVYKQHKKIVELLLACEHIDPDRANNQGKTPLMRAVEAGNEALVKLFLDCPREHPCHAR